MIKNILISGLLIFSCVSLFAGNPDRQGEAGAYELVMNPWARSAGFHTMNTSFIGGVEAMRLNVAGLTSIDNTEIRVGVNQYLKGTTINMNALGFAQRVGTGVFGLSIMNVDFGDIDVTTTNSPEGTGATYSPTFLNMGLSYANNFENKISVGITARVVTESIDNVSASAACFDAGVQYVSGPKDNMKLGISLRNVGTKMKYSGDGLSFRTQTPNPGASNSITVDHRANGFDLPSMLNLGLSYDFYLGATADSDMASLKNRITLFGNFTANSYSRDDLGGGVEYAWNNMLMLRASYKVQIGDVDDVFQDQAYTGLAFGASVQLPIKKDGNERVAFDYGYRASNPFEGTHSFGLVLSL